MAQGKSKQAPDPSGAEVAVAPAGYERTWTFLSNHAHVLVCVAEQPDVRIRDIATRVGITERAASNIVSDLELDGYITRERVGRNNHYALHMDRPLRHPIERHRMIGDLLDLLANR
jgi:Mn-dependent DtxR family transcriptional regulator